MGEAEMTHAKDTGTTGALSLATSRIPLEKATDPMVKAFAEFETAEQETIADVLKSTTMAPEEAQGALMEPTEAEVEAMLDEMGTDTVATLRDTQAGMAFDRAYVTAQLDGHRKLLDIQETYLTAGQNREHLSMTKLARATITEHIAHLEDLRSSTG